MRLRTKLILGIGILFLLMVIIMYILPTYFIRKDIYHAADNVHALLAEEHQELAKSQKVWIENVVEDLKQNLNAILVMLYQEKNFSSNLAFSSSSKNDLDVWDGLARLTGYDPDIGFVQAHSPKENKAAVVNPHAAPFYPIASLHRENKIVLLTLDQLPGTKKEDFIFIGIPLIEELQKEKGYTEYALINPKNVGVEQKKIFEEFSKLTPEIIQNALGDIKVVSFDDLERAHPSSYYRAIKVKMARLLAPLIVEGFQIDDQTTLLPEGLARVDREGNGIALLSRDVFSTKPLFDDRLYYENHLPKDSPPPLADGAIVIPDSERDHVYIGNTLLIDHTFISIGSPLGELIRQLALSSNKTILVRIGTQFWIGFDEAGKKLSKERLDKIIQMGLADHNRGMIKMDGMIFSYARIASLFNDSFLLYNLSTMGGEKTIIGTLLDLENKLSNRISLQLSIISLATMILVLLFLGRIGLSVIQPIRKLALATEDVVAGKYGEIVLPDVGKRKDEVAILTQSFKDMVKGLQERERIRGVLDKVVSKDVADEILRTQIHLGGEDRIVTMLFGDIRGFTHLTESLSPQETIGMLNACMTKVSRVIEGEGGVIDKYVGDEVMAIFGAPTTHPDHALRAVSTGMLIVETLKKWNQERAAAGEAAIEMGIGINTGLVVVGNMGAEDRLNYTVLGSNVNLAARLSEVSKPNQLIISELTLTQPNVKESFYVEQLAPIILKGFSDPINIYEVIGFKWEEI